MATFSAIFSARERGALGKSFIFIGCHAPEGFYRFNTIHYPTEGAVGAMCSSLFSRGKKVWL